MHRAIPVMNKACTERIRKREHDQHRQRIKSMKPQIDTTVPMVCHLDHLRNNLKREQLLEDRYYTIDRDNKILLQKMSEIMSKQTFMSGAGSKSATSLGRDGRKHELMRITKENQALLNRIQHAQPVYNRVAWEDAYKRSGEYMKNKAEYPVCLPSRKVLSRSASSSLVPLQTQMQQQPEDGVHHPHKEQQGDELRYVLKEGKKIGETYFLVEMATDGRTLVISAYDADSRVTRDLIVSEKNHRKLYRDAAGDYNLIAEKLYVDGEQLRIHHLQDVQDDPGQP